MSDTRVFLAAPYSQWMDPNTGEVAVPHRTQLERLRTRFIEAGASVFNAHHNESWGRGWLPPQECTPADFHAMRAADVVCAFVGTPTSSGVAVELGWASAFGKPIVVVVPENSGCSPLILGIDSITTGRHVVVPEWWREQDITEITKLTLSLAGKSGVAELPDGRGDHSRLGYVGVGVVD